MSDLSLAMVEVVEALGVFLFPAEDSSSLVEETPDGGEALCAGGGGGGGGGGGMHIRSFRAFSSCSLLGGSAGAAGSDGRSRAEWAASILTGCCGNGGGGGGGCGAATATASRDWCVVVAAVEGAIRKAEVLALGGSGSACDNGPVEETAMAWWPAVPPCVRAAWPRSRRSLMSGLLSSPAWAGVNSLTALFSFQDIFGCFGNLG